MDLLSTHAAALSHRSSYFLNRDFLFLIGVGVTHFFPPREISIPNCLDHPIHFAQVECPIPNCVWGHPNFFSFFDLVWRGSLESVSTRRINPFSRRVFGRSVNYFV